MASATTQVTIRDIRDLAELKAVEGLQKEVWACSDLEVFPSLALIPLIEVGGVLLGAFASDKLVGFVFGFPGIEDGRPILHSDMLAVKREFRSQALGYKLKLAQRERALAKGINKITWTFDPLQSRNAHLNFAKLGVIADKYKVNYYGETSSPLHRGGTDRLWVSWLLNSDRVHQRIGSPILVSNSTLSAPTSASALVRIGPNGEPIKNERVLEESTAVMEIPENINNLMTEAPNLALAWRAATRQAFASAFSSGFIVEDFRWGHHHSPTGSYCLRKTTSSKTN